MRSTISAIIAEPMKVPTKTKRPTTTIFQPCDLSASMSLPTARPAGESGDRDYAAERDYIGDRGEALPRDEVRDRDSADDYRKQHEQAGDGLDEGRGGGSARVALSADPVADEYLEAADHEENCHLTVIHYLFPPSCAPAFVGTLGASLTPILRTSQLASGRLIKTHM